MSHLLQKKESIYALLVVLNLQSQSQLVVASIKSREKKKSLVRNYVKFHKSLISEAAYIRRLETPKF